MSIYIYIHNIYIYIYIYITCMRACVCIRLFVRARACEADAPWAGVLCTPQVVSGSQLCMQRRARVVRLVYVR